jgi:hypothetical protein
VNDTTQQSLDDAVQPEGEQKTEVAEYSKTAAALARLQFRMKDVVHDVKSKEGMAAAKKDVAELRGLRTGLEELRLQLNSDDQARIKKRNTEAARITELIEGLEDPLKAQIRAEADRIEELKLKKQREEEERAAALRQRIAQISAIAVRAVGKDSDNIREKIATVEALDVTSFEEMQPVAANAKADTLVTLNELLRSTVLAEESARALAESNRLLAEQREANERLEREARERREAEEAAERQRKHDAEMAEIEARNAREALAQLRTSITDLVFEAASGTASEIAACITRLDEIDVPTGHDLEGLRASTRQKLLTMRQAAETAERHAREQRERDAAERARIEEAERKATARRQQSMELIDSIRQFPRIREGATIEQLRAAIEDVKAIAIGEDLGDLQTTAQQAKDAAVEEMARMLERAEQEEARRVEREREEQAQREEDARAEAARAERLRLAEARAAAMDDVVQLLMDVLSDGTLAKSKRGPTNALAQRIADMLKTIDPLPGGQYYAADGTLMTAEGTRSVFDDVDK